MLGGQRGGLWREATMRARRSLRERVRAFMLRPPTREEELLVIVTAVACVLTLLTAYLLR